MRRTQQAFPVELEGLSLRAAAVLGPEAAEVPGLGEGPPQPVAGPVEEEALEGLPRLLAVLAEVLGAPVQRVPVAPALQAVAARLGFPSVMQRHITQGMEPGNKNITQRVERGDTHGKQNNALQLRWAAGRRMTSSAAGRRRTSSGGGGGGGTAPAAGNPGGFEALAVRRRRLGAGSRWGGSGEGEEGEGRASRGEKGGGLLIG